MAWAGKVLDALTSTENVERQARGRLFHQAAVAMRLFEWPARVELYMSLIDGSKVDAVVGAVVSLFKAWRIRTFWASLGGW